MNDIESAFMWDIYGKNNYGIAIQSNFDKLKKSFNNYLDRDVYIGKVKYINYDEYSLRQDNILYSFIHKRKSYEPENELRAIISKITLNIWELPDWWINNPINYDIFIRKGEYMPVNLDGLIDKIYVSPNSPSWIYELTESILKKYGLNKKVIQSSLAYDPIF